MRRVDQPVQTRLLAHSISCCCLGRSILQSKTWTWVKWTTASLMTPLFPMIVQCPVSPCQISHGTPTSVLAHKPSWQQALTCTTSLCDICSMGAFLTSGGNSWHGGILCKMSLIVQCPRRAGHHSAHSGEHGMPDGIKCWRLGSRLRMLVAHSVSNTCSTCTRVRGRSLPSRRLPEIGEPISENSTMIAYCTGSSGGSRDSIVG